MKSIPMTIKNAVNEYIFIRTCFTALILNTKKRFSRITVIIAYRIQTNTAGL